MSSLHGVIRAYTCVLTHVFIRAPRSVCFTSRATLRQKEGPVGNKFYAFVFLSASCLLLSLYLENSFYFLPNEHWRL